MGAGVEPGGGSPICLPALVFSFSFLRTSEELHGKLRCSRVGGQRRHQHRPAKAARRPEHNTSWNCSASELHGSYYKFTQSDLLVESPNLKGRDKEIARANCSSSLDRRERRKIRRKVFIGL